MAKNIINPKDTTSILQLNDAMNEIKTEVGFIKNSGLFKEELSARDTIVEEITKQNKRGMLGLTNRREREKVKTTKRVSDKWAVQIPYQEEIENFTKEDVHQVAKSWEDATEEQIYDILSEKLVVVNENIDRGQEYMAWTAAQGVMRDPKDGSEVLDIFAVTGVNRPVVNLDLTDVTVNLLTWMSSFRNRVMRDNKRSNTSGQIDIFVTQEVFDAFVNHPSVFAAYQMAFQTRGQEYLDKVVKPIGTVNRGVYGIVSEFEHGGVRLIVAPQEFIFEDSDIYEDGTADVEPAVKADEGFAVVRGIRDSFKFVYGQSNSLVSEGLAKKYAWRSPIIENAYFEITASSAPMAYTTTPELCYQFKFKTK